MEQHIIYVGLDVHKDTIAVAPAEGASEVKSGSLGRSRIRRLG